MNGQQTVFVYLEVPAPAPALGVAERHVAVAEHEGVTYGIRSMAVCGQIGEYQIGDETISAVAATCERCQMAVRFANFGGQQPVEL